MEFDKYLKDATPTKYWSAISFLDKVYCEIDFDTEPLFKKGGLYFRENVIFQMLSKDGKVSLNLCVVGKNRCQVGTGRKGYKWINPISI